MADHVMLRVAKYVMTVLGIWPVKLSGYKLKLYRTYHRMSFYYLMMFNVTLVIKALQVMGKNFGETSANLGVTIVFWITSIKVVICTSPQITNLLKNIEASEDVIMQRTEEEILTIHKNHVRTCTRENLAQFFVGTFGISLYFIAPIINNYNNNNAEDQSFIFVSWFPFDEYKNYKYAYLIQFVAGCYGAGYTISTSMCLFSLMIFSRCEMKILQHVFRNFTAYVNEYAEANKTSDVDAQNIVLERCILEHRKIIKSVKTLEEAIKTYMLLDFTVSSFQFSMLLIQIIQRPTLDVTLVSVIMYAGTMALQLYLIYSNAHELIIQSSNIAQAIFESAWYDLSIDVKKKLIIVIMRAQKPLYVSIGPLYQMRCELLLKPHKPNQHNLVVMYSDEGVFDPYIFQGRFAYITTRSLKF